MEKTSKEALLESNKIFKEYGKLSVSFCFNVKNSEEFGGQGTIGAVKISTTFNAKEFDIKNACSDFAVAIAVQKISKTMNVAPKDVILITNEEFEEIQKATSENVCDFVM